MRMTYRQLLHKLVELSDEQLQCDLTVADGINTECFPADLRFADEDNFDSLDEGHPVIYYPVEE